MCVCGGGWFVVVVLQGSSLVLSSKAESWCWLLYLLWQEIFVHLITRNHVIHLSSMRFSLGSLTFPSGTEEGTFHDF